MDLAALGVRALGPGLGAEPIEKITHVTGDWTLRFLLASLAVTPGFTGFLLLRSPALMSTRAWMRRLGRRWVVLHRVVYAAAIAGCLHFLWLVEADLREP